MPEKYKMTISRTTINKLGIKLYDKASAVVSELIANSYDADAELVTVHIPLNRWLATKKGDKIIDSGLEITIEDDGHGMEPEVINDFYLKIGTNPRIDPRRGLTSLKKKRPRMGRKGIGKLAPFGICKIIEVISAGGKRVRSKGYKTAHIILNFDDIIADTDESYYPNIGEYDETYSEKTGTKIKLRNFNQRRTPNQETFDRQMSRRFGTKLPKFKINIINTEAEDRESGEWEVGELALDINMDTLIELEKIGTEEKGYKDIPKLTKEDGTELPINGWIAYSNQSYRNEEMAGIRIYARGKIVSTTRDFGVKSGFTGEYKMRSYLIGEIHADWIDTDNEEDLIRSDRQDILWDTEKGAAFKVWGREIIKIIARRARNPMRKIASKIFMEKSKLKEKAKERYKDKTVIDAAIKVGQTIGSIASLDDLEDEEYVTNLTELVLTIAPHKLLVDTLREVSDEKAEHPLDAIIKLLSDVKIAEIASLGQIAKERIIAIKKLEALISPGMDTKERDLQELLEHSPWLIDPQWTVLQSNKMFKTMRKSFERWYERTYDAKVTTSTIESETKRPDFILLHIGSNVEIVELKNVGHELTDKEFIRILDYYSAVDDFMIANKSLKDLFPFLHISVICDKLNLKDKRSSLSFKTLEDNNLLKQRTWEELLTDTRKVHERFLEVEEV